MLMKIGLMGGTFDPVHLGHLAVAAEAQLQANLARIVFVPAGQPYFKDISTITPAQHRLSMLDLAVKSFPFYRVSTMEIERSGPSFAVDTVSRLKDQLGPENEIYFILGWDSLMSLPLWREPRRLISLCRLIAAPRPGFSSPDIRLLEKDLPGISARTLMMSRPLVDISSTSVRRQVREGHPVDNLVPAAVAAYISQHGLYR